MALRRLPFPRYLNRPKLWMLYEQDELKVVFIVEAITIFVLFVLSVPPFLMVIVIAAVGWVTIKIYRKSAKSVSPGYIDHFFYSIGMSHPEESALKKKKRPFLPYGFIRRFRD